MSRKQVTLQLDVVLLREPLLAISVKLCDLRARPSLFLSRIGCGGGDGFRLARCDLLRKAGVYCLLFRLLCAGVLLVEVRHPVDILVAGRFGEDLHSRGVALQPLNELRVAVHSLPVRNCRSKLVLKTILHRHRRGLRDALELLLQLGDRAFQLGDICTRLFARHAAGEVNKVSAERVFIFLADELRLVLLGRGFRRRLGLLHRGQELVKLLDLTVPRLNHPIQASITLFPLLRLVENARNIVVLVFGGGVRDNTLVGLLLVDFGLHCLLIGFGVLPVRALVTC